MRYLEYLLPHLLPKEDGAYFGNVRRILYWTSIRVILLKFRALPRAGRSAPSFQDLESNAVLSPQRTLKLGLDMYLQIQNVSY